MWNCFSRPKEAKSEIKFIRLFGIAKLVTSE